MKKLFCFLPVFFLAVVCNPLSAQPWLKAIKDNKSDNFYDYQKAFNDYWKNKDVEFEEENNCSEGGWQQFKRWENFMEPRVYPSGKFFKPTILFDEWNKFKKQNKQSAKSANWELLGPSVVPSNGGGNGRVNCICFHPADPNTFWIGAASGGLWKTTDGGNTWTCMNTDLLPALSIADIAVDPLHPDTLYIATGDGYGYEVENIFWGGNYSAGILKSTDGGVTWNATGLTYLQDDKNIVQRIVVCNSNTQVLIASTRDGLYRSADGGATWTAVKNEHFFDIKFNVLNDSIIYASSSYDVYKSTDLGNTWTQISTGINPDGGRISLAVTEANPLVIYAYSNTSSAGNTFYKSSNGGSTWQAKTSPDGSGTFYGYYDMVLAVSPANENIVYTGGVNVIKSTDGGSTWTAVSDWAGWPSSNYVHADNHDIEFLPGNGNVIFSCNDGGFFKSSDNGTTWTDMSNTLAISQFYRLGCSVTDQNLVYVGAQDNGTSRFDGTNWSQVFGADGMETVVDYTNANIVYVSYQGGALQKSTDGGNNFTDITPCSGAWTTPYVMHPTDHLTLFVGCSDIYKTTDGGNSWNATSSNLTGGETLRSLKVSDSDPNYIYAGTLGNLYMTSNGGSSWTTITSGLPVSNASITGIAISDYDPLKIWVTFTAYADGEKVYASTNGGVSWLNVSGTLPNIPVDCIVFQNNSSDALYIGTDFGVFYTDNTMNDWVSYNTGLPNVIIDELEIQYDASKIRAATYGRGLWESNLNSTIVYSVDAGVYAFSSVPSTSCDTVIAPVVRIKNFGSDTLISLTLNYKLDGGSVSTYAWSGTLATNQYANISLPSMNISSGSHTLTAYTSNPNGTTDGNVNNDSKSVTFTIIGTGIALPLTEDFEASSFPPAGWTSSTWALSTAAGGFGTSSNSAMIDFYSLYTGTKGTLMTDFLNFNSLNPSLFLKFDVAYARYDATYSDTLVVKLSEDCGNTWNILWSKGGTDLATAPDANTPFVPTSSQWRNETIDLSSYAGLEKIKIQFEGRSGYGNDLYLDNINLDAYWGLQENNTAINPVTIYPNPNSGEFFIDMNTPQKDLVTVSIYNSVGSLIKNISFVPDNDEPHLAFDLSEQAKGLYMIKVESDGMAVNRMITIM